MPFQPIDFANIAPQGNPFIRDLVDNLSSAYKAGQIPAQLQRDRTKEEIANSKNKLLLDEQPQLFKAKMNSESLGNAIKNLQIQALERNNDPAKRIAYIKALASSLKNAGVLGGDNATPASNGANNSNWDSSGLVNAFIRSQLGLPQQTPDEKLQEQLNLYQMKQRFTKSADNPTTANVTSNQGIIQAVNNTLPLIQELSDFHAPGQFIGKYFSPNDQAMYEAKVATITDSLVGALKLPKTNESIALVQKIVGKRAWENDKSYVKRLNALMEDLKKRKGRARDALIGLGIRDDNVTDSGQTFNLETGEFE